MKLGDFQVDILSGGTLRLDGGNMFGPVPRVLWQKKIQPDDQHRIPMTTNCLLLRTADTRILIDVGYGSKADEKQRAFQGLEEGNPVARSLDALGVQPDEIDIVILTHLHFDHVGGCTRRGPNNRLELVFPNARHIVQSTEWQDATTQPPELAGSYFKEDYMPIESSGRLEIVDGTADILPGLSVRCVGGHTRGMQIVEIGRNELGQPLGVALADLAPTTHHLRTFWHVAYDQFPLDVRRTKPVELGRVADAGAVAFFCHDTLRPWSYLKRDPKHEFLPVDSVD